MYFQKMVINYQLKCLTILRLITNGADHVEIILCGD